MDSVVIYEDIELPSGSIVRMRRPYGCDIVNMLKESDNQEIPEGEELSLSEQYDFAISTLTKVTDLKKEELLAMYDVDLNVLIANMGRFLPNNTAEAE